MSAALWLESSAFLMVGGAFYCCKIVVGCWWSCGYKMVTCWLQMGCSFSLSVTFTAGFLSGRKPLPLRYLKVHGDAVGEGCPGIAGGNLQDVVAGRRGVRQSSAATLQGDT